MFVYGITITCALITLHTASGQPAPPEVPTPSLNDITLDKLLTDRGASVANDNSNTTQAPSNIDIGNQGGPTSSTIPQCLNNNCILEFIPDECKVIPKLEQNGIQCFGCPNWNVSCIDRMNNKKARVAVPEQPRPRVACPLMKCPTVMIPDECKIIETYEFMGKTCKKCPTMRSDCKLSIVNTAVRKIACPLMKCDNVFIPKECIEYPTFDFHGRTCQACPKWRSGCEMKPVVLNNPVIQRPACPTLICDNYVPLECQEIQTYDFNGQLCKNCPAWRQGCRESDRINNVNLSLQEPDAQCPKFACPSLLIPDECKVEQSFNFKGKTCKTCPIWKDGCKPNPTLQSPQTNVCPQLKCDNLQVPQACVQEETYMIGNTLCYKCPSIKPECQTYVSPRPLVSINLSEKDSLTKPDAPCPLVRCKSLDIPEECIEYETYNFQGKQCQGCPKTMENCTLSAVSCPLLPCPRIFIPQECRIEHPYDFQGKTCYKCPTWKEGCPPSAINVNTNQPNTTPEIACPLMKCPKILIPPECREEQPYDFQGKQCFKCPTWRENCIPSGSKLEQQNQTTKPIINPEVSCPVMACTLILIPDECRELQPYDFNGKTCYKCPRWRQGCLPGTPATIQEPVPEIACPVMKCPESHKIPVECKEEQSYDFNGKVCFRCPKWRDGCKPTPPETLVKPVPHAPPEVACPLIDCEYVPPECREEQTFNFRGKICNLCPKIRIGCTPTVVSKEDIQSFVAAKKEIKCPEVGCPFIMIPPECEEKQPYQYQGKTCYKCPKWRENCPAVTGSTATGAIHGSSKATNNTISSLPELLPIEQLVRLIQQTHCPPLPCPNLNIPVQCQVQTTYQYMGTACPGCPIWNTACLTGSNTPNNMNMNGILAFNLFTMMSKK